MCDRARVYSLCDMVIQDRETNKRSLIGMFDRLYTNRFPGFQ